jgi:ketosteroid isomerase-like protein
MKMVRSLLLVVIATLGCSPSPEAGTSPAGLTPDDDAAIRSLIAEWDRTWVADDHAATAALLAEDYVEARPTAVEGPRAAQELYEGLTMTYTSLNSTVRRLEGVGDLAYAWVSFDHRYTLDAGERRQQIGNGLWVLKKGADGRWRFSGSGFQSRSTPDSTGA